MTRALAAVVVAACGAAPAQPVAPAAPPPAPPPPAAKLADLAWLAGTWHSAQLDAHWQVVDGALYGIALNDGGFEVNIIDDSDDDGKPVPITLLALENGRDPMRFALRSATPQQIVLADEHEHVVRVIKTATGWRGEFTDQPGRHPTVFVMQAGALPVGRELEAADRAFALDTEAHGADGWSAHFAEGGAMWRGDGRLEGPAIHDAIARTLAKGPLRWTPIASGLRGDLGFTLGTFTFGDPATAHGSYATIWRKQVDGTWKVVFDIGRPGDP